MHQEDQGAVYIEDPRKPSHPRHLCQDERANGIVCKVIDAKTLKCEILRKENGSKRSKSPY